MLRMCCGARTSRERQYLKKDSEDHRPVALTTSGGVPAINNSVVPPMQKQWPVVRGYPNADQIELHRRKKRDLDRERKPLVKR